MSLGFCNGAHLSMGKGLGLVDIVCSGWFIVRWHSLELRLIGEGESFASSSVSLYDWSDWLAVLTS